MNIADRMSSIPFSGIRKMFEEVMRREKKGEKIIHLEIGRPDFDTPSHIKDGAKKALDEAKVAVVPGTVLGKYGSDFIRISYANSYENLEQAMERMEGALKKI